MLFVVLDVVGDQSSELGLVPDDGAVAEFAAQGAEPPFDVTVRDRCPWWGLGNIDAFSAEDFVEGVGELAGTVTHEHLALVEPGGAGDGAIPAARRIDQTVDAAIGWPNRTSSPVARR